MNKSPIRHAFRGGTKAIRYNVNMAFIFLNLDIFLKVAPSAPSLIQAHYMPNFFHLIFLVLVTRWLQNFEMNYSYHSVIMRNYPISMVVNILL